MDYHDKDDLELLAMSNDDLYSVRNRVEIENRRQARLLGLEEKTRHAVTTCIQLVVQDSTRYFIPDYGYNSDSDATTSDGDSSDESSSNKSPSRAALFRQSNLAIRELRNLCAEGKDHQNTIWKTLVCDQLLKNTVNAVSRLVMRCDKLEVEEGVSEMKSAVEYALLLTWTQLFFNLTAGNDLNRTRLFHTFVAPYLSLPPLGSFPSSIPGNALALPQSTSEMPEFEDVYRFWRFVLRTKAEPLQQCATGLLHNTLIRDAKKTTKVNSKDPIMAQLWDCYQWGAGTDVVTQIEVRFIPYRIHALFTYPSCPTFNETCVPATFLHEYNDQVMPFSWLAFWVLFPDLALTGRAALERLLVSSAEGGVGLSPELLIRALSTTITLGSTSRVSQAGITTQRDIYDENYGTQSCFVGMLPDALWPSRSAREKLEKLSLQQTQADAHDREALCIEERKSIPDNELKQGDSTRSTQVCLNGTSFAFSERERIERLRAEAQGLVQSSSDTPNSKNTRRVDTLSSISPTLHIDNESDTDDDSGYNNDDSNEDLTTNGDPKFTREENSIWRFAILRFSLLSVPHLVQVLCVSTLRALAILSRSLRGASLGLPADLADAFAQQARLAVASNDSTDEFVSGIVLPTEAEFEQQMGTSIHWGHSEFKLALSQLQSVESVLAYRKAQLEKSQQLGAPELAPQCPLSHEADAWKPLSAWARGVGGDAGDVLATLTHRFARKSLDVLSRLAMCLDITATELLEHAQQNDPKMSLWLERTSDEQKLQYGYLAGLQSTVASFSHNLGSWLVAVGGLAESSGGLPELRASPFVLDLTSTLPEAAKDNELPTVGSTAPLLNTVDASDSIYPKMRTDIATGSETKTGEGVPKTLLEGASLRAPIQSVINSPHTFSPSLLFLMQPGVHAFATLTSVLVDENSAVSSSEDVIDEEDLKAFALGPVFKSTKVTRGTVLWHLFFASLDTQNQTGIPGISTGTLLHAALSLQLVYPRIFRVGPLPDGVTSHGMHEMNDASRAVKRFSLPSRIEAVAIAALLRMLLLADTLDVPVHANDGLQEIRREAALESLQQRKQHTVSLEVVEDDEEGEEEQEAEKRAILSQPYKKKVAVNVTPESFKCDIIRVIGHLAYLCGTPLQTLLGDWGALELVLNHCYFDPHNQYIREWSILSVRHLAHEHYGNQTRIANLTLQGVQQSKTLENMGLKAWLDPDTGKIRVASQGENATTPETSTSPSTVSTDAHEADNEDDSAIQLVNSLTGEAVQRRPGASELAGPYPADIADINIERLRELEHNSINAKF